MVNVKRTSSNAKAKSCLIALLEFYAVARVLITTSEPVTMTNVTNPLLLLLKEVAEIEDIDTAIRKISFNKCQYQDDMLTCLQVNMNGTTFEITLDQITALIAAMDELKKTVAWNSLSVDGGGDFHHFKLVAEERSIRTEHIYIGKDEGQRDITLKENNLTRNAIKAIEENLYQCPPIGKSKLKSVQHRFFIVDPISTFGRMILRNKFEQDLEKDLSMLIPDILHDSWLNSGTIVASIFINYHIYFGDLKRLKLCRTCSKMFLEAKTNTEYCSKPCRKKGWTWNKKNSTYAKIKCRERQKQFFNYKEDVELQWEKADCDQCVLDQLPEGGKCSKWRDKFGDEEIDRRMEKRKKN